METTDEKSNALVPIGSGQLQKAQNAIAITNKILAGKQDSRQWWDALPDKWKRILYAHFELIKNNIEIEIFLLFENIFDLYRKNFNRKFEVKESIPNSELNQIKAIQRINARRYNIEDLSPLKELKNLTDLDLSSNQIEDLSPLKELQHLTDLYLYGNQIKDLSSLKELKKLTTLDLSNNQLEDISPLKELQNLTNLHLHSNQIEDISALKRLKNLRNLNLFDNQIKDLSLLRGLKSLTDLSLSHNQIKDLSPLKELKNLRHLLVDKKFKGESVIDEIKQANPNIEITFE